MHKCPEVMPTAPTREQRSDMLVGCAPKAHVQKQRRLNFTRITQFLHWFTKSWETKSTAQNILERAWLRMLEAWGLPESHVNGRKHCRHLAGQLWVSRGDTVLLTSCEPGVWPKPCFAIRTLCSFISRNHTNLLQATCMHRPASRIYNI